MDINSVIKELNTMPKIIKRDAQTWISTLQNGNEQMEIYAGLLAKILQNEMLLSNAYSTRSLRGTEKRLNMLFKRLGNAYNVMEEYLEALRIIKSRTERMRQRVQLWNDDEYVSAYTIEWELTTNKLLEFLQFLAKRYDYEWEVKEVVVRQLERMDSNYDIFIFGKAWCDNKHAGGDEFHNKLKEFYKCIGLRHYT